MYHLCPCMTRCYLLSELVLYLVWQGWQAGRGRAAARRAGPGRRGVCRQGHEHPRRLWR